MGQRELSCPRRSPPLQPSGGPFHVRFLTRIPTGRGVYSCPCMAIVARPWTLAAGDKSCQSAAGVTGDCCCVHGLSLTAKTPTRYWTVTSIMGSNNKTRQLFLAGSQRAVLKIIKPSTVVYGGMHRCALVRTPGLQIYW